MLEIEAQSDVRGQKLQKPLEAVIEEEVSEVMSSRSSISVQADPDVRHTTKVTEESFYEPMELQ